MKNNIATGQSKTLKKTYNNNGNSINHSMSTNKFKKPEQNQLNKPSNNPFTFENQEQGDQFSPHAPNIPSIPNTPNKNTLKTCLPEEEITKKIETFRNKLLKDLMKILSEEKHNEEERDIIYQKTTNPKERKRLENIIAMERAQSSEKIIKFNE